MALTLTEFRAQFDAPLRTGLIEVIEHNSIILPLLNFIPVDDFVYTYPERTALPGIAFRGLNENYTTGIGVYNRRSEPLAIFGGEVKTDVQLSNKRGGAARANELIGKVKAAGLFFDRHFFHGDIASNSKSFDGLRTRLTGDQVLSAGDNGGPLTIDLVTQLIDAVRGGGGAGKVLFMNKVLRRKLSALVVGSAGGAAVRDVGGQLTEFQGVRIVVTEEDHTGTALLGFNEQRGTNPLTTSIYCVRFGSSVDEEDVQGLLGSTFMEVKYVGDFGTYLLDVIDNNAGIAVFNGRSAARLRGVTGA